MAFNGRPRQFLIILFLRGKCRLPLEFLSTRGDCLHRTLPIHWIVLIAVLNTMDSAMPMRVLSLMKFYRMSRNIPARTEDLFISPKKEMTGPLAVRAAARFALSQLPGNAHPSS